jgi:ribonuclease HII
MLMSHFSGCELEAGCDEAGRGCLAGPVFGAAVVFPRDYTHPLLDDSKKLSDKKRAILKDVIKNDAIAWAVCRVDNRQIDQINILNASILAMQNAVRQLGVAPQHIIVDGNRFKPLDGIRHTCVVKGDGKYLSIAAASILAKTARDEYMIELHDAYPCYGWNENMGYPTEHHRRAIAEHGISPYHRRSFNLSFQLKLDLDI